MHYCSAEISEEEVIRGKVLKFVMEKAVWVVKDGVRIVPDVWDRTKQDEAEEVHKWIQTMQAV